MDSEYRSACSFANDFSKRQNQKRHSKRTDQNPGVPSDKVGCEFCRDTCSCDIYDIVSNEDGGKCPVEVFCDLIGFYTPLDSFVSKVFQSYFVDT